MPRDVDWAAKKAQSLRSYDANVVRKFDILTGVGPKRLNKGIPCLARQAARWVFASGASGQRCPGYSQRDDCVGGMCALWNPNWVERGRYQINWHVIETGIRVRRS